MLTDGFFSFSLSTSFVTSASLSPGALIDAVVNHFSSDARSTLTSQKLTLCGACPISAYEWRPAEGGKQPYFISAADGAGLSIAGLWDEWRDPETRESVFSCTLIVTAANDFTRHIHERMPVLLGRQDYDVWLTGKAGVELLRPAPNDLLHMWPVSGDHGQADT